MQQVSFKIIHMNPLFKRAKDIFAPGCVSLIFNTHRTKPDYQKDALTLKNLIKDAENRLAEIRDKKQVAAVIDQLNALAAKIDHSQNTESMVVLANTDFADFVRLPLAVTDRYVVDNTFATRELIRSIHQEANYYVLVVSRENARLIEAFNDKVVKEFTTPFPVDNNLDTPSKLKSSMGKAMDNMAEEWFNRVDKLVQEATKEEPLPIVVATETRNFNHYKKVADHPNRIYGHINRKSDAAKAGVIVKEAWEVVRAILKERHQKRLSELQAAANANKVLSDLSEIWRAIGAGRGETLFVKKGYFLSATVHKDVVTPVAKMEAPTPDYFDDVIDEMIERNLAFGGDTVFVSDDAIEKYQNVALVVRY